MHVARCLLHVKGSGAYDRRMKAAVRKVQRQAHLPRTGRILSLTTPLYWIQNHANLLTLLPQGSLTTAGGTADVAGPARYRSQHYLQEIKSAVDVLEDLHAWACSG